MKWTTLLPAVCIATAAISCSDSGIVGSERSESTGRPKSLESGTVIVFVHWQSEGLAGKRVEIVELERTATTDETGLAEFVVPIGTYTVRAYEINRGGPVLWFVDTEISVSPKEETRVDVVDCLPCV